MKNAIKLFGLIAITAVIGFSMSACSINLGDDGGNNNGGGTAVTNVTLSQTSLSLAVGSSATLTATVDPSNAANKTVTWSSSNANVAAVNNGLVTALAAGNATITVTTADGGKTATCAVTVTNGGDGNTFTSVDAMTTWLGNRPDNTASTPYTVKLNVPNLSSLAYIGVFSKKYVNLDLSGSTFTSMGNGFFGSSIYLTGVTIPNSILSIGQNVFAGCTNLPSITIPNSVTSIGKQAFASCTTLTSVTFTATSKVSTIGEGAFSGCTSLTSVTIPNSVISIEYGAFDNCTNLASVTIGNSVTTIKQNAFSRCTNLASVTIGNSVTTIGESAFANCTSLTSITIPNSVTNIMAAAFNNCTNLTSVTFQKADTTISTSTNTFPSNGSLRTAYTAGGAGTYTKSGTTWTKQS